MRTRDVGLALATAVGCEAVWGRASLIGGGPQCQFTYRELVRRVLEAVGVGMLPGEAFTTAPFATDWLDTAESQQLLGYQRRTLDDYVQDMIQTLGYRRRLARLFRPLVRTHLLSRSPHLRKLGRESALRSPVVRRLYRRTADFLGFRFRCLCVLRGSWAAG